MKLAVVFKTWRRLFGSLAILSLALIATACTSKIGQPVHDASLRSILIVPVENESGNPQVDLIFPPVLQYVFAERGYYVYDNRLIQAVLERHNLWDQEAFRKVKPEELAALFGADGVLYMKVLSYNVTTRIIYTNRRIGLSYKMFARDGKLMHEDMHYVQLPLDPDSSEYNPLASVINGVAAALEKDGPINAMQAVTSISFDFAPGPYHDDSFGWTVRVPFQDKVILNPHPRSKNETRLETDRDPDNI